MCIVECLFMFMCALFSAPVWCTFHCFRWLLLSVCVCVCVNGDGGGGGDGSDDGVKKYTSRQSYN